MDSYTGTSGTSGTSGTPMSQLIKPTVGRKVWYRPSKLDTTGNSGMRVSVPIDSPAGGQPLDATVIAVWDDRLINVRVTDISGKQFTRTCQLLQPGDTPQKDADAEPIVGYCEWMPYQINTAARSEMKNQMTREQLAKSMADRLMGWRLPDDFCPDGGVSFSRTVGTADGERPRSEMGPSWWPTGTNLLSHGQAVKMLLDIMPPFIEAQHPALAAMQPLDPEAAADVQDAA